MQDTLSKPITLCFKVDIHAIRLASFDNQKIKHEYSHLLFFPSSDILQYATTCTAHLIRLYIVGATSDDRDNIFLVQAEYLLFNFGSLTLHINYIHSISLIVIFFWISYSFFSAEIKLTLTHDVMIDCANNIILSVYYDRFSINILQKY